jgi:hypothetical protein
MDNWSAHGNQNAGTTINATTATTTTRLLLLTLLLFFLIFRGTPSNEEQIFPRDMGLVGFPCFSKFARLNLALDTALPQHNWDRTLVNTIGEQKDTGASLGESLKHY